LPAPARESLTLDDRFPGFMEKLLPLLAENMSVQAGAEIDCLAILDSSAGIIPLAEYTHKYLPYVKDLLTLFRAKHPKTPVLYYAKGASPEIWPLLESLSIQGIGLDHYQSLGATLTQHHSRFAIQGNFPPEWMNLPWTEAEPKLRAAFVEIATLPREMRRGWICGLGHGMQPAGREENVRGFVQLVREVFR
jgi:uroporphyrinogen decarboxylase